MSVSMGARGIPNFAEAGRTEREREAAAAAVERPAASVERAPERIVA
jgi:hypothetical protein